MVICSLDALKKSSKKKETEIENEKVETFQKLDDPKKTGKKKIGTMKFLASTSYLLAGLTLTLPQLLL